MPLPLFEIKIAGKPIAIIKSGDRQLQFVKIKKFHSKYFATKEGIFNKRLVAGAMVFSYGLGLVATNCVNSFSYGYDKLRFIKPVFIGDTIYTIRTNMEKRPKYLKMLSLIHI